MADNYGCGLVIEEPSEEDTARIAPVLEAWARIRVKEKDREPGKSVMGTIPCPVCGAVLNYGIAGGNGHVHGCCSTPGCLQWME